MIIVSIIICSVIICIYIYRYICMYIYIYIYIYGLLGGFLVCPARAGQRETKQVETSELTFNQGKNINM